MHDRPTIEELLAAVERFLQDEAVPALPRHLSYQARVAANVVGIVARELAQEERHLREEWLGLATLLEDDDPLPRSREDQRAALHERNQQLVDRIRAGEADQGPWRQQLLAHLTRTTRAKLEVAKRP